MYRPTRKVPNKKESSEKRQKQNRPKNNVNTLKPVAVKTEKVAATEPKQKKRNNRLYLLLRLKPNLLR